MKRFLATIGIAIIQFLSSSAKAQEKFFDTESDLAGQTAHAPISPKISLQPDFQQNQSAQPIYAADSMDDSIPSPDMAPNIHPAALASTEASTRPEQESARQGQFPGVGSSTFGLEEFFSHFAPYEPIYYVYSTQSPTTKFQISLRYRMFPANGSLAQQYGWLRGFNAAMTLTGVQNTNAPSVPIVDVSYKPELFYYWENIPNKILPADSQLGMVLGIGHESNGRDGTASREIQMVYLRPIINLPIGEQGWFVSFSPKIYEYIGGVDGNPDIARYRGYADLQFIVGKRDGLQLRTIGRVGSHFDRGSAELDLSYPLTKILNGNHDVSLYVQYFTGYGDDLLDYNKRVSIIRFGFAVVR
jgi:outer membrane phospholipase A